MYDDKSKRFYRKRRGYKMKKITVAAISLLLVIGLVLTGCSSKDDMNNMDHSKMNHSQMNNKE
jgi:uncharacterized protein YcfL